MAKRNAGASSTTLPYSSLDAALGLSESQRARHQARVVARDAMLHGSAKGPSVKRDNTLRGLPKKTLLGLSKTLPAALRSVWSDDSAPNDESSLVGLSRQVESSQRKPRAAARLKPPAAPPRSHVGRPHIPDYSADPTDHDIQFVEVIARQPLSTAERSSGADQPAKRSRFLPLLLSGALAIASAYVVQSQPEVLDATKSAWLELETSVRSRLETTTSAASPTPATAPAPQPAQTNAEPVTTTSETEGLWTPVEDTSASATAEQAPTKIGDGRDTPKKKSRRSHRARHRKINKDG